jgi:3-methylcrotonyl-CoA carboxylase alpha subunit
MIAKIIAWGEDRRAALARLRGALGETAVLGVVTNLGLLVRVAAHPEFAAAATDTGFIERHRDELLPGHRPVPDRAVIVVVLSRLLARQTAVETAARHSGDPFSPWARIDGWRLNGRGHHEFLLRNGTEELTVTATAKAGGWRLQLGGQVFLGRAERRSDGRLAIVLDGRHTPVAVLDHGPETVVLLDGESWRLVEIDPLISHQGEDPTAGRLTAPMPGRVAELMVGVGDVVRRGEPLIIIEAMKIEHTVTAPADGIVEAVRFSVGDLVEEGEELLALSASRREEHG